MRRSLAAAFAALLLPTPAALSQQGKSAPPPAEKGIVRFEPVGDQKEIPERYRLEAHRFAYELREKRTMPASKVDVYDLTFPSPVTSPHLENNTVHAEYYRPHGEGPFPCVIVLDILAGDQKVARMMASHLAQSGIAALTVQMAYYGPRRPRGSNLRLVSPDLDHTLDAIRQTVLDLRRATAWMEARPEVDGKRLGIMGTSLGSFLAALTAEMEPKLGRVAVVLGGGGFVDAYWDHPKVELLRRVYEAFGGTKEQMAKLIAPVDPLTCAANLKGRKLLILAARRDEVVPPRMAEALWNATGRQQIIWYDTTHFGAVFFLVPGMQHVVRHFSSDK